LRILFLPLSILLSHVSRCLALADAAIGRGHQVGFVAGRTTAELIQRAGYTVFQAPEPPMLPVMAAGAPWDYQKALREQVGRPLFGDENASFDFCKLVEADLQAIREFKADIIVLDNSISGRIAARSAACPFVEIRNHVGFWVTPEADMTSQGTQFRDPALLFFEMTGRLGDSLGSGSPIGMPILVPGYYEFEVGQGRCSFAWPVFVGHLRWAGWERLDRGDWVAEVDRGQPTVFVTLGSSLPFPQVIAIAIETLVESGFQLIVSTGMLFEPKEFKGPSRSLIMRKYIYNDLALRMADVVLFHGGHGTAMEALLSGTPAIVIPFNGDQFAVGRRLEELGVGRVLDAPPHSITPLDILKGVEAVYANRVYQATARRFRRHIRRHEGGAGSAVRFIEDYVAGCAPSPPRT
jgi:UDP:flavonoid glycosyltransferase YjiC (YdhE family)